MTAGGICKETCRLLAVSILVLFTTFALSQFCVVSCAGHSVLQWHMAAANKESFLLLLLLLLLSEIITDIGTALFYQVCGAMDENVMNYQPTVQFFTSCVEIIGKVSCAVAVICDCILCLLRVAKLWAQAADPRGPVNRHLQIT